MCTTTIASPKPEKCVKGNYLKTIAIAFFFVQLAGLLIFLIGPDNRPSNVLDY